MGQKKKKGPPADESLEFRYPPSDIEKLLRAAPPLMYVSEVCDDGSERALSNKTAITIVLHGIHITETFLKRCGNTQLNFTESEGKVMISVGSADELRELMLNPGFTKLFRQYQSDEHYYYEKARYVIMEHKPGCVADTQVCEGSYLYKEMCTETEIAQLKAEVKQLKTKLLLAGLTVRQRKIFGLIAEGLSVAVIAERLAISRSDVYGIRSSIKNRLKLNATDELIKFATELDTKRL